MFLIVMPDEDDGDNISYELSEVDLTLVTMYEFIEDLVNGDFE